MIKTTDSLEEILQTARAELRKGGAQKRHPFHTAVLSTSGEKGAESRWVVFRKLTELNRLLVFTDWRSTKIEDLQRNPRASLLFYQPKQGLQIRIRAEVLLHRQNELSAVYWPGVKSTGARDYNGVLPPGQVIDDPAEGNRLAESISDEFFTVLEFVPSEIEVLQIGREGHIRAVFNRSDDRWEGKFLAP